MIKQQVSFKEIAKILSEEIIAGREMLDRAAIGNEDSWKAVLNMPYFWELRHETGGLYSVKNMTTEELKQSLVEDLLFVHVERSRGAIASYPKEQMFKHLESRSGDITIKQSIEKSFVELIETGMIVEHNGLVSIPIISLEQAQEFSGYYILTAEELDNSRDMVDSMLQAGGRELLSDAFEDIIIDVDSIESNSFKP